MSPTHRSGRRHALQLAAVGLGVGVSGCSIRDGDDAERPPTGEAVPELEAIEETLLEYKNEVGASAAAMAVARNGTIQYERGFGWADEAETEVTRPDALFRIASISKLITFGAVRKLVDEGALAPDDPVYPYLDSNRRQANRPTSGSATSRCDIW